VTLLLLAFDTSISSGCCCGWRLFFFSSVQLFPAFLALLSSLLLMASLLLLASKLFLTSCLPCRGCNSPWYSVAIIDIKSILSQPTYRTHWEDRLSLRSRWTSPRWQCLLPRWQCLSPRSLCHDHETFELLETKLPYTSYNVHCTANHKMKNATQSTTQLFYYYKHWRERNNTKNNLIKSVNKLFFKERVTLTA